MCSDKERSRACPHRLGSSLHTYCLPPQQVAFALGHGHGRKPPQAHSNPARSRLSAAVACVGCRFASAAVRACCRVASTAAMSSHRRGRDASPSNMVLLLPGKGPGRTEVPYSALDELAERSGQEVSGIECVRARVEPRRRARALAVRCRALVSPYADLATV